MLLQCYGHGSSSSTTSDNINNNNGNPRRPNGAVLINGLWNSMMITKCINSAEASHCPTGRKIIHKDLDHSNIP